jgi:GNAT superfamily N-acetyltransferase
MPAAITVRKARAQDADTVLQLIRALAAYEKLDPPDEAAERRLRNDLFGSGSRLDAFLVEVDGRAAGYALVLETYSSFLALPTLYLEDIFVLPEFRGRQAGSAIFRAMVQEARDRGCGRMEWAVLDWNTPAQVFYERHGAQRLSNWQTWRLQANEFNSLLHGIPPKA